MMSSDIEPMFEAVFPVGIYGAQYGVGMKEFIKKFSSTDTLHDDNFGKEVHHRGERIFQGGKITLDVEAYSYDSRGREEKGRFVRGGRRQIALKRNKALIVVFDLTDKTSFENAQSICKAIREEHYTGPIFIVGNKSDYVDRLSVHTEEIQEFAEENSLQYAEVSAKENTGIDKLFEDMVGLAIDIPERVVSFAKWKSDLEKISNSYEEDDKEKIQKVIGCAAKLMMLGPEASFSEEEKEFVKDFSNALDAVQSLKIESLSWKNISNVLVFIPSIVRWAKTGKFLFRKNENIKNKVNKNMPGWLNDTQENKQTEGIKNDV